MAEIDGIHIHQRSTSIKGQPWSTHLVPCLEVFGFIVLVQVAFGFWTQHPCQIPWSAACNVGHGGIDGSNAVIAFSLRIPLIALDT